MSEKTKVKSSEELDFVASVSTPKNPDSHEFTSRINIPVLPLEGISHPNLTV